MRIWIDTALVLVVLSNLSLLAGSRLIACIRRTAFQGAVLGVLTLLLEEDLGATKTIVLVAATIGFKTLLFPWLLQRAVREVDIKREIEPFVGYSTSLVIGIAMLGISFWLSSRLPLPATAVGSLIVPVGLFGILCGLFLIVSRRKALTQVLGYVVVENGIYVLGVPLVHTPFLVELGVLLDAFVAVFIMGITIHQMQREFDHIDADRLSTLKD